MRTKPNCGVDHSTSSSARRDRWIAVIEAAARNSSAKSRSDTASIELRAGRSKAKARGGRVAVDRKAGAGQRGGAERAFVEPRAGVGEAAAIAPEHLDIGQEMMAEGDRLGRLQVGEARHDAGAVLLGAAEQRRLQVAQQPVGRVDRIAYPQAQIGRDLVVARARGVQLAARLADQLGQPRLDVQVDVLECCAERKAFRLDLGPDLLEAGQDRVALGVIEQAHGGQHAGMRRRARDVVRVEPLVEADRGVNLLHQGRRAALEMAAPEVHAAWPRGRLGRACSRPGPNDPKGYDGHEYLVCSSGCCCSRSRRCRPRRSISRPPSRSPRPSSTFSMARATR